MRIKINIHNVKCRRSEQSLLNALMTLLLCGALFMATAATADAQWTNGLFGFWRMDGNGDDSSGNHRPLSLFGGVGFDSGINCRALKLHNDIQQYAARETDDPELDFGGNDFTLSLWAYYENTAGEQVLIEKLQGGSGPGWTLTKVVNNVVRFATAGQAACTIPRSHFPCMSGIISSCAGQAAG